METLKILLPIIALIVSVITIYIGKKNNRRQLRIGKLEEILESILFLSNYYSQLWILAKYLKKIEVKAEENLSTKDLEKQFKERLEEFLKFLERDKVQQITSRISVLANAYLPNGKLKNRIMTFNHLSGALFGGIIHRDYKNIIDYYYPHGIPRPKKMGELLILIEKDLIKQMKLGYSSLNNKEFEKYRLHDFINDAGIGK